LDAIATLSSTCETMRRELHLADQGLWTISAAYVLGKRGPGVQVLRLVHVSAKGV